MGRSFRATLVTVAITALAVLTWGPGGAARPATAEAYAYDFNCGVLEVGHWCLGNVRHYYFSMTAHYPGNYVCAKFIRDDNGQRYAQACAYDRIDLTVCFKCILLKPLTYNGGPNRHTIWGNAYY